MLIAIVFTWKKKIPFICKILIFRLLSQNFNLITEVSSYFLNFEFISQKFELVSWNSKTVTWTFDLWIFFGRNFQSMHCCDAVYMYVLDFSHVVWLVALLCVCRQEAAVVCSWTWQPMKKLCTPISLMVRDRFLHLFPNY